MIRRRGHQPEQEDDSSSDEEDAFTAMSRKRPKTSRTNSAAAEEGKKQTITTETSGIDASAPAISTSAGPGSGSGSTTTMEGKKPLTLTSSMKRHHKPSDTRKAKMDALLEELEAEKNNKKQNHNRPTSRHEHQLEKKGSYVRPEEEHLTTNIFVGGLSPSVTEEDLSRLFKEFGEKRCNAMTLLLWLFHACA
jgi:RNA recognition motif. (a.k.a. RRM, RBD, or RNP domain)